MQPVEGGVMLLAAAANIQASAQIYYAAGTYSSFYFT
jgi:hypothetical protein